MEIFRRLLVTPRGSKNGQFSSSFYLAIRNFYKKKLYQKIACARYLQLMLHVN